MGYVRVSWTFLATVVVALAADFSRAKVCFATMTLSVHSLADGLADKILSPGPTRNGKASSRILLSPDRLNLSLLTNLLLALIKLLRPVTRTIVRIVLCCEEKKRGNGVHTGT